MKPTQPSGVRARKAGFPGKHAFPRRILAALCGAALIAALPAAAQKIPDQRDQDKYHLCITLSKSNPEAAFEMALSWQDFGGGEPARHCVATALMGLGIYDEAGRRFEALAQESRDDPEIRAGIFAHAAQAWLLDGNLKRAESVLNGALSLQPDDPNLLIDRAVVRATAKNFNKAVEDLDAAIERDPNRAEAYAYRASARRHLKQVKAAETDADQALRFDPDHLEALLERGILRRLRGANEGARADWLKILHRAPDSAAARTARGNLEKMDVKKP